MFGSNKKEIELLTQQLAQAQEALATEKSISARLQNQLREAEQKNSDQMKQLVAVEVQQQEQAKELEALRQLVEMKDTMFLQFPEKWIRFDDIRSFSVNAEGYVTELAGHRLLLPRGREGW